MEWDGQNAARDKGEWLLELIDEAAALAAPHSFVPARELRDSQGAVVARVTGLHCDDMHLSPSQQCLQLCSKYACFVTTPKKPLALQTLRTGRPGAESSSHSATFFPASDS